MDSVQITVREIEEDYPVYKLEDRIVLDEGFRMNLTERDNVCMRSLSSIMPYFVAVYNGVDRRELGFLRDGKKAFVQCLDPCWYTDGGTVVFELERIRSAEPKSREQEASNDSDQRTHR